MAAKEMKELTILLLGETGVGKSTFINSIVNYMSFESMDAANGRPICLIPGGFGITDPKTGIPVKVTFGDQDLNENTADTTKSATQYPKCYKFQNDNIVLNIIDTPGIADTDGVDKDDRNMQNILDFLSNYREINAFCVLLKPNDARVDVIFKYCLFQLFSHLNKSAANNILFLFTNARSTHYMPGDSGPALMTILKQIKERPPNVDIPYNKNTVYCFDCESFRYLVASVPPNNIQFDPKYKSSYVESWKISVNECKRLFERIIQLTPHKVMDTLSVNDTKQIIQMLTKPLADITKNIADNINQCQRHSVGIKQSSGTIKELRHKLYIPSVEIITTPLDRPKTVCGDGQCCKRHITNEITQINYTTECHSPCYLDFSDGNIVGNKGLLRCKAFNKYSGTDRNPYWSKPSFSRSLSDKFMSIFISSTTCQKCGHSYQKHLHLYYETESKVTKVTDQVINNKLVSAQLAAEAKELQIRRLDQRIVDLNAESETIVQSMSMFACFLANNALTPVNDAFGDYVRHLIANERHGPPGAQNQATIARFEQLLAQYDSQYQIISNAMHSPSGGHNITAKMVNECVDKLCKLKYKGADIRNMLAIQRRGKCNHHLVHNQIEYSPAPHASFNMTKLF